jgi:hypothetical protein
VRVVGGRLAHAEPCITIAAAASPAIPQRATVPSNEYRTFPPRRADIVASMRTPDRPETGAIRILRLPAAIAQNDF